MAVNWDLARQPNIIGNALGAFQAGRQDREQAEQRNALIADRQAQTKQREAEFAVEQEDRATKQSDAMRAKTAQMARLFAHAEKGPEQWEQAKAAATQLGFDVSAIPQQFDPNWAAQQRLIVEAYGKDGGQQGNQ